MTPMPPSCAIAIAVRASVTVSIAALSTGMLSRTRRVSQVRDVGVARQDLRRGGNEQDVVERQSFAQLITQHRDSPGHRTCCHAVK